MNTQIRRFRDAGTVARELTAELIQGLHNGPYFASWWKPCPERVPIAADALYRVIESVAESADDTDELAPSLALLWVEELGGRNESWECYELLELTGMTAVQFCTFWWLLFVDPGHPLTIPSITRRLNGLRRFAHRLVLEVMYPSVGASETFGCVPDQMIEHGLTPLQLYEVEFTNNERGYPHWLR